MEHTKLCTKLQMFVLQNSTPDSATKHGNPKKQQTSSKEKKSLVKNLDTKNLIIVVLVVKMKKLSASIYKPFWGWVERRIGLKIERERERERERRVYMQESSF
jgi:hypothetical protein